MLRRQLERAAERTSRRGEVIAASRHEPQPEVRLPDMCVEREDPLESCPDLIEAPGLRRQRPASGALELGLQVRTLEPKPKAVCLGERVGIGA